MRYLEVPEMNKKLLKMNIRKGFLSILAHYKFLTCTLNLNKH